MWMKGHIHGELLLSALPDLFLLIYSLAQNPEDAEVRLRSYSYSSPKLKPSRPLLNREATITDLAEGEWTFTPWPRDHSAPRSQLNGHMCHVSQGEDQTGVTNQLSLYKVCLLSVLLWYSFTTHVCKYIQYECAELRPCFVPCRWCVQQQQSFTTSSFISL